jgi:hypothetical protein
LQLRRVRETADDGHFRKGGALGACAEGAGCAGDGASAAKEGGHFCLLETVRWVVLVVVGERGGLEDGVLIEGGDGMRGVDVVGW